MGAKVSVSVWAVILQNETLLQFWAMRVLTLPGDFEFLLPTRNQRLGMVKKLAQGLKLLCKRNITVSQLYLIVSTYTSTSYTTSKSLGEIPQPTLTANQHRMGFTSFLLIYPTFILPCLMDEWRDGDMAKWRVGWMDEWMVGFMSRSSDLTFIVIWKQSMSKKVSGYILYQRKAQNIYLTLTVNREVNKM